jgi:hypothetical protein
MSKQLVVALSEAVTRRNWRSLMTRNTLFLCLWSFCWLLISGCAPAETIPANPTPEIAQITPTAVATSTKIMPATPTPATMTAIEERLYPTTTPTPDPTLPPWTREPSSTPTIWPTYTPIPGSVWPILFAGNPCTVKDDSTYCNELWPESGQWYQINSDGSGLRRVPQLDNPEPEDYDGRNIQVLRFSPDGEKIAYVAGNHLFVSDLHNDKPLALVELPLNYWAVLGGFDFVPGSDCLMIYWRSDPQSQRFETLSLELVCPDPLNRQVLYTIELPDLNAGSASGKLSPQGDAILISGQDDDGRNRLYICDISSNSNLRLLFAEPDTDEGMIFLGPFRWQLDGWYIEYIINNYQDQEHLIVTYNLVDRKGVPIETILTTSSNNLFLSHHHDWSPDGREVVFAKQNDYPEMSGIYMSNLEAGTIRQVLSEFHISRGPLWSPEFP